MTTTVRGIVLSHEPVGELDSSVEFLTADFGLVRARAKSAKRSRRRYAGGLDLFCHDELTLKGDPRGRPYLVELVVLNSFYPLREDLARCFAAGAAAQWARRLFRDSLPGPEAYRLLGQTLALFCRESDEIRLAALGAVFRTKLLSTIGLMPKLDGCAKCDSEGPFSPSLDLEAGGVLCESCSGHTRGAEAVRLDEPERRTLADAEARPLSDWAALLPGLVRAHDLNRLLGRFASYHGHLPTLP